MKQKTTPANPHHNDDLSPEEMNIYIRIDGNAFSATFNDHINLQESVTGFGETPIAAIADLISCCKMYKDNRFHTKLP